MCSLLFSIGRRTRLIACAVASSRDRHYEKARSRLWLDLWEIKEKSQWLLTLDQTATSHGDSDGTLTPVLGNCRSAKHFLTSMDTFRSCACVNFKGRNGTALKFLSTIQIFILFGFVEQYQQIHSWTNYYNCTWSRWHSWRIIVMEVLEWW